MAVWDVNSKSSTKPEPSLKYIQETTFSQLACLSPILPNKSGVWLLATTNIGKFQRQRFGEKRKGTFYLKATQSGRLTGSCLKATPLENPEEKPATLCLASPRLLPVLLPFKIPSTGNYRWLLSHPPSSLASLLATVGPQAPFFSKMPFTTWLPGPSGPMKHRLACLHSGSKREHVSPLP